MQKLLLSAHTLIAQELTREQMDSFLRTLLPKPVTHYTNYLSAKLIPTPLGPMIGIGDEQTLYFLDFVDHPRLKQRIVKLQKKMLVTIHEQDTPVLESIKTELAAYFTQTLQKFTTPFVLVGSPFQKATWQALLTIPYGTTISYKALASTSSSC